MRRTVGLIVLLACVPSAWPAAPPIAGSRGLTKAQQTWLLSARDDLNRLAVAGRFTDAERLALKILAQHEFAQGEHNWQTADARLDVEHWRRLVKVPAERRAAVARSIEMHERATRLYRESKFKQAEALFREVLALRKQNLGDDHPFTAVCYNDVASCLDSLGKPAEGQILHEKALAIRKKALGEQHPSTATSYNNLAFCLYAQGKRAEAIELFQKALSILEKTLGQQHPKTATNCDNVAYCLQQQGKLAQARPLHEKALRIRQRSIIC